MAWHILPEHKAAVVMAHLPDIAGAELQRHTVKGVPVTIARHDYPSWRALKQAGLPVPPPLAYYAWPGEYPPLRVQRETVAAMIEHDRLFVLNGLGTGKTLSAVWGADYLRSVGEVRRVLVIAPKTIVHGTWEKTLYRTLLNERVHVLTGDRKKKLAMVGDTATRWLVVNPESLHLVADNLPEVDLIIVDEFTKFKNRTTRAWRALHRASRNTRLWLMSGTPHPQSPMDAYGPIKLVHRDVTLDKRMWQDLTMLQVSQFTWVAREGVEQTLASWLQPSVRFALSDVTELPDVRTIEVEVELTAQQRNMIHKLKTDALAELEDGATITAVNAAAVLSKIMQAMSGAVYGGEGKERFTHTLPAEPFLQAIEGLVDQADTPVLVFTPFLSAVDRICTHLEDAGHRVAVITGETKDRAAVFRAFEKGELDALVAVASTMAHGVDGLQKSGRYIVWAGPPYSAEVYTQANGRLERMGQERQVIIYHLIRSPLDAELYKRQKDKRDLQDTVLNYLHTKGA